MGYDITHFRILKQDGFGVFPSDLPRLSECPTFWEDPPTEPDTAKVDSYWQTDEAGFATLKPYNRFCELYFPWTGAGNGGLLHILRDVILPCFKGTAELLLTFEGGESYLGIRCDNGVVTEHDVELVLKKEPRKREAG